MNFCGSLLVPCSGGDKKFIKREEEPDEYWSSKGEKAGSNPMKAGVCGCLCDLLRFQADHLRYSHHLRYSCHVA
jgi:hypothetical protein